MAFLAGIGFRSEGGLGIGFRLAYGLVLPILDVSMGRNLTMQLTLGYAFVD